MAAPRGFVRLGRREHRFNCAHTGTPLKRNREEIVLDGECSEGEFVVWRVLGFVGKPNPLVFSRVRKHPTRRRGKEIL